MLEIVMGTLYLSLGISVSLLTIYHILSNWMGWSVEQKVVQFGITLISVGFTQRGIELLFFNAPHPRPGGYIAVVGMMMCLYYYLKPIDSRVYKPSWQQVMKEQEPEDIYNKYIEILNHSATIRNESTPHAQKYTTHYEE